MARGWGILASAVAVARPPGVLVLGLPACVGLGCAALGAVVGLAAALAVAGGVAWSGTAVGAGAAFMRSETA